MTKLTAILALLACAGVVLFAWQQLRSPGSSEAHDDVLDVVQVPTAHIPGDIGAAKELNGESGSAPSQIPSGSASESNPSLPGSVPTTPFGLKVAAKRRTYLTVYDASDPRTPLFDGWLTPQSPALELLGSGFIVEAPDPSGLVLHRDGLQVRTESSPIEIR